MSRIISLFSTLENSKKTKKIYMLSYPNAIVGGWAGGVTPYYLPAILVEDDV